MIEILKKNNFWGNKLPFEGFRRESYLETFSNNLGSSLIKVVIGQRRSGKSYLLRSLIRFMITERKITPTNILYINKDLYDYNSIKNQHDLHNLILEYRNAVKPEGKVYLFIDEIQEIDEWEKYLNSISQDHVSEYEAFITGSNAHLLSSELGTYLSGRTVLLPVYPFSYGEYIAFNQVLKSRQSYIKYLQKGGLPEIYQLSSDDLIVNYMESLKDSIVLRDIVHRHKVRDIDLLRKLVDFMADSVGSQFSSKSVNQSLKSFGYSSNIETIGNYLQFLCDAWYLHKATRFDIRGKKLLQGDAKYYLNDTGFKYHLSSSFDFGIGRYLENAVYLHFRRSGHLVYNGKLDDKEIDLIAEKDGKRIYIQIAYILADEQIIRREFGNLELIKDNYQKIVVSLDDMSLGNRNGIEHVQAWEL